MNALLSPINPSRVRSLPKYYSWLDHRLVREGYLKKLSNEAVSFYLFLVSVGDRFGMSYYSDRAVYSRVNISDIYAARQELINADLIAYAKPVYQVLALPEKKHSKPEISAVTGGTPASDEEVTALFAKFRGGCR